MDIFSNALFLKVIGKSVSFKVRVFYYFFYWLINEIFIFVSLNKREKF